MKTYEEEILSAIDKIETVTMEAEMNVITALCNEYEKSILILENYEGDDVSCFDIFQEGFKDDVKEAFKGKSGEGIIKKILMALPRLFMAIGKVIRAAWNNRKSKRMERELNTLKRQVEDLTQNVDTNASKHRDSDRFVHTNKSMTDGRLDLIERNMRASETFMKNLQSNVNSNKAVSDETIASLRKEIDKLREDYINQKDDKESNTKIDIITKQLEEQSVVIDAINALLIVRIDYEGIYDLYEDIHKLLTEVDEYLAQGKTYIDRYNNPFESQTLTKLKEHMENGWLETGERSVENFVYDFVTAGQLMSKSEIMATKIDDLCGKIARRFIDDSQSINYKMENNDSDDWKTKSENLKKIWDTLKMILSYMKEVSNNVEKSQRDVRYAAYTVQDYWNKIHGTNTKVSGRLFN